MSAAYPDDYFVRGEVYETLDACQQVDRLLGRLRRQSLMDDGSWLVNKAHLAEIRKTLETILEEQA